MGFRLSVLVVIIGLIWATGTVPDRGRNGCVECHRPHHETLGTCIDCHRGNPNTERINIAHYRLIGRKYAFFNLPQNPVVKDGRRRIQTYACRRCHRISRKGNTLAANLDLSLVNRLPETLAEAVKNPAEYMPNFYLAETDIIKIVNAVLDGAAAVPQSHESPRNIHFQEVTNNNENSFVEHCGDCHRVLSQPWGGLGRGNIGPNLSGLFSNSYFKNFNGGMPWDATGLKQWLQNPRSIRPNTPMPPIDVSPNELTNILNTFEIVS